MSTTAAMMIRPTAAAPAAAPMIIVIDEVEDEAGEERGGEGEGGRGAVTATAETPSCVITVWLNELVVREARSVAMAASASDRETNVGNTITTTAS